MSLEQWLGLSGLVLGLLGGGWGFWYGRRQAARQRGLDERHREITRKALAGSWVITLVGIYVLFFLYAFGASFSAAAALGILLIVHMAGWTCLQVYYNLKH